MVDSTGDSATLRSIGRETLSSTYASPAHKPNQQRQPEFKVVNVKEPPKFYDNSFRCLHSNIEFVVIVSLICAAGEVFLGCWFLYALSGASFHSSSSKYITIGLGMLFAQLVRIYALLTWLSSSKQELMKAYAATTLCSVVSILVLLPMGCLVLFVSVVVFELVVFHVRPQIEVLQAFLLVAGFDLTFSICYGSLVACCFQNRLQKRQIYLRTFQINPASLPSKQLHRQRQQQQRQQQQHHQPPFSTRTTTTPLSVQKQEYESRIYYHTDQQCFYDEHQNTMVAYV